MLKKTIGKLVINSERTQQLEEARFRILLLSIIFMMGFTLIAGKLFILTIGGQNTGQAVASIATATKTSTSEPAANAIRSNILDRNGDILATSLKTQSLYADPKFIDNPTRVAKNLIKTLPELNYGEILKDLQSNKRFVWIKRHLTPEQQYQVNALGHPGLAFTPETRRIYPKGPLFSHVLGFADIDGKGLSGVENTFNNLLAKGQDDLTLTLDTRLQHIARRETMRTIEKFNAKGGAAMIMDIHSGDILAMVSLPDFDPHFPEQATKDQRFNRNTLGVFEMGSVFKIFSTAAALEYQTTEIDRRYDTSEPLKIGRFRIRDYHPEKRPLSVAEMFIKSSNIGSAQLAQEMGKEKLQDFYRDLGLFDRVSLELPEMGKPLLPPRWGEIANMTASYGHGIAVSPLHTILATSIISNGGYAVKPTLIQPPPKEDEYDEIKAKISIISPQTSRMMRQLMEMVVMSGTASKAFIPGYRIGGKTGTAEKVSKKGGYAEKNLRSSFVGAFPMPNPQYAVLVMIDEPIGNKESYGYATAGWTAAPTSGRIIKHMAELLNMPPHYGDGAEIQQTMAPYVMSKEEEERLASFGTH